MIHGGWVAGLLTAVWIPIYIYRTETYFEARQVYDRAERFSTTATPLLIATHLTLACVHLSFVEIPGLRAAAAVGLLAFTVAFWFWGRRLISPLDVRTRPDEPPLEFRRDGAFGIVRHPLYFSYLLFNTAAVLAIPTALHLVTWAAAVASIVIRARQEERRLHAQLGEAYAAYCREVAGLIPFVW